MIPANAGLDRIIRDAKRQAYWRGPMDAKRLDRKYDRLAYAGAVVGFIAMWAMLAAACWAAGGAS